MSDATSICVLYPDLLGTYGDGGNAVVLARRLSWRGLPVEVVDVQLGDPVPERADIYLLGGGEDQPQTSVVEQLRGGALRRAVANGAVVLAVCAGMQILGNEFAVAGGAMRPGLELLDVRTVRGEGERRVGELVVQPDQEFGSVPFTGYENHGGVTLLGPSARRLGAVTFGHGNDDGLGSEGAVTGRVMGTYLHGPALARNPELADLLLSWATGEELGPLNDHDAAELRADRLASVDLRSRPSGGVRRFFPWSRAS